MGYYESQFSCAPNWPGYGRLVGDQVNKMRRYESKSVLRIRHRYESWPALLY